MEKKRKSGTAYLMQLAGKYKLHLFVSALFGIASALCSFVPYVMVYRSILVLLDGEGNALRYGLIAAAAIAGKFLCSIVSGTFSHIGAFNTLYNVRTQISRHIAKVNLGFFTDHASGEIKKVIIEDVERIERFLAHQIPDVTSAICAPVIVFIYLLTINVPMALCLLVRDLPGNRRGVWPRPGQEFAGQAHQVELAPELGVFAQVHPVLLHVARLGMAEAALPGQGLAGQPAAHGHQRGARGFQQEAPLGADATAVQPVQVQVLLVEQQARAEQRGEQGALLA